MVGLIGYGDAWSRESSSRPPPDATAEATLRARMPAIADGSSRKTSNALPGPFAPGMKAGTVATASVTRRNEATSPRVR